MIMTLICYNERYFLPTYKCQFFLYSKFIYCLKKDLLIRSYYGREGLDYNLGRINMGGCDFSTRPYTYCDVESPNLEHFELQEEDLLYKVFQNK